MGYKKNAGKRPALQGVVFYDREYSTDNHFVKVSKAFELSCCSSEDFDG
jgi:hypothetical protein